MKKLVCLLLAMIMVFSLCACGGTPSASKDKENAEPAGDAGSAAGAEPAEDAQAGDSEESSSSDNAQKVALICNVGGLGDKSFNDSGYAGLERAAKELGTEYTIVEPEDVSQGETYLRQFAEAGYGAVITLEYSHADYLKDMPDEYPDTVFVATDQEVENDKALSIIFDYHQSSYLAGYAAALIASGDYPIIEGRATHGDHTIGVICALESDGFHNFTEAYTQGAVAADPDVKVLYDWSVGFTDTQLSKQVAQNMIENENADVVFQVCGTAGLGIIQGCYEDNVYAIGVDSDQDYIQPGYVLTSVIKGVDVAVYEVCKRLKEGTLEGGVLALPLGNGTGITDMSTIAEYVTDQEVFEQFKAKIEEQRQAILNGDIQVVHGALGERFER